MEEKATLSDKIQEMEHKNLQLASECETIGKIFNTKGGRVDPPKGISPITFDWHER